MSKILTGNTNVAGSIQPTSVSNNDTLVGTISTSPNTAITASAVSQPSTQTTRGVVYSQDAPPLEYTGAESNSACVYVNNHEKTIQAEVKLQSLLGHTPSTAFPGNEGYKNTVDIENLQTEIDSCLNTVNELIDSNRIHTDKMNSAMSHLEELVEEYKQLCNSFTSTTNSEITTVRSKTCELSKKITALETKIASNQSRMDVLLSEEASERATTDDQLRTEIVDESVRATTAETELRSQLGVVTSNSQKALSELSALKSKTSSLNTMIESIINSRELNQVIPELQEQTALLQQEVESSKCLTEYELTNIRTLLDSIGVVAHNALIHTSGHDALIDELQKSDGSIKTALAGIETDTKNFTSEFKTTGKKLTSLIETLQSTMAHEIATRNEHDELQDNELENMNIRVANLQTDLTTLIHNIRTELKQMDKHLEDKVTNMKYEFIDGGTAPI